MAVPPVKVGRLARASFGVAMASFLIIPFVAAGGTVAEASPKAQVAASPDLAPQTVKGAGAFSNLSVTVTQTSQLVNQAVEVTWSGATPTLATPNGSVLGNFLQIMQCWAEPGQLPDREQCQYGGFLNVPDGTANVASRQTSGRVTDPLETEYAPVPGDIKLKFVPFTGVDGTVEASGRSQFFDGASTNEVPIGRTSADGTGRVFFEMQTGLEAPGLGCGQVINGRTPDCYLAVVPRDLTEVDGTTVGTRNDDALRSTPLSQSNWNNRLLVKLGFSPIGQSCSFGRPETATYGTEFITEAITAWQPKLCVLGPRNYGFSSLSDDVTREQLLGDDPGLAFVTRTVPGAEEAMYAPVAVSALAFVANIDRTMPNIDPSGKAIGPDKVPAEIKAKVGQRFEDIKLNPRLIAKLLTQSYVFDLANGTANLSKNPFDLSRDPEFLALNPDFKPGGYTMQLGSELGRMLVPAGLTDTADLLWRYVLSDKDARDFLAGKPDPFGTTLNEFYKGLTLPTNSFPRADLGCRLPFTAPENFTLESCTLDIYPYGGSFAQTARQVSRGDTGRRSVPRLSQVQTYGLEAAQVLSRRAMLGLSDTASINRYRQVPVKLRNASGNYVSPDAAGMTAAVSAMSSDPQGLLITNPATKAPDAYPLTQVTYAATVPSELTAAQRSDYAALLAYAAADGQVTGASPGQLPGGYLPLPSGLVTILSAVATELASYTPPPSPSPTPSETESAAPTASPIDSVPVPEVPVAEQPLPSTAPQPSVSGSPVATPSTTPVAAAGPAGPTPSDPASSSRVALLAALVLGGAALLARAVLPWVARR